MTSPSTVRVAAVPGAFLAAFALLSWGGCTPAPAAGGDQPAGRSGGTGGKGGSGTGGSSAGTGGSSGDQTLGRSLYESPLPDGNSFACATCHALSEPSSDGLRRPGHPIGDATHRKQWKNGKSATFLDAVNSCLVEWMVAPAWTADDRHFVALRDFLDGQAPAGVAANVPFAIVAAPADLTGGDVARGRATFDKTCVVCHGPGGTGTDRGPKVMGSARDAGYIAKRIRTSGSAHSTVYPDLTGGVMPFWAKDRMSDDEVRDVVAFLRDVPATADAGSVPQPTSDAGAPVDAGTDAAPVVPGKDAGITPDTGGPISGCPKTNAKVGWKADLGVNTGEGQVSGFVTMVDDCTLELTDFSYDGEGIDVRVFGSKVKNFNPGFIIGPDLVGKKFKKQILRVTLPAGKTLDDLDWVSIWCTKARANFGSGPFLKP
jgi:mono/diheme cytochrome c family protein